MKMRKTITSIFMVPTLGIPKDILKSNGFINGYIKDGGKEEQYNGCIYLLFHPKHLEKFREFLDDEYERTKTIVDDYDYEDGYVVVVYSLDKKYKKDFELIRLGKYSKTSEEFQKLFPKVTRISVNGLVRNEVSLQYRIFNRTEDLIKYWEEVLDVVFDEDQEVWSTFDEEKETLNIKKVKENVQS
jgi:hypothetical protein